MSPILIMRVEEVVSVLPDGWLLMKLTVSIARIVSFRFIFFSEKITKENKKPHS